MIYLDNAATTQIDPKVLQSMMPYLTEQFGNPGSIYKIGRDAKAAVEKARRQVADFLNADPSQIVFTSGGTEGNNMVFNMMKNRMYSTRKTHTVISNIEHKSVIRSAGKLCEDNIHFDMSYAEASVAGYAPLSAVKDAVRDNTGLVSVMHTNNEIGISNPDLISISEFCNQNGIVFHTDCVQAAGCQKIDVKKIGCDFATISSHKIHGPKGVGAIFIKDIDNYHPMIIGGSEQEFGMRGGTENVAGIVGFGMACELLSQYPRSIEKDLGMLRIAFRGALNEALKDHGLQGAVMIRGGGKVTTLTIDGIDAESLILLLDNNGVCVSAGSACNSKDNTPSYVLKAIGMTDEGARSTIRVSMSKSNDVPQVVEAAMIIASCISTLKGM